MKASTVNGAEDVDDPVLEGVSTATVPGVVPEGFASVVVKGPVSVALSVNCIVVVTKGSVVEDTGVMTTTVPGSVPEGDTIVVVIVPEKVPSPVYDTDVVVNDGEDVPVKVASALTLLEVEPDPGSTIMTVPGLVPEGNARVLVRVPDNPTVPVAVDVDMTNGPELDNPVELEDGSTTTTVPGTDPDAVLTVVVIGDVRIPEALGEMVRVVKDPLEVSLGAVLELVPVSVAPSLRLGDTELVLGDIETILVEVTPLLTMTIVVKDKLAELVG